MNEEPLRLEKATHPDGFVDFYAILGVTPSTPTSEIQESINSLYQEAQTHRDHRVPARRREYQTLLEILPQARLVLLDEARSKRYRAYCHAVEMELPRMPYPEFLSGLVREKEAVDVRSDILTIRDLSRLRIATNGEAADGTPIPTPAPKTETPPPVTPAHMANHAPPETPSAPLMAQPPEEKASVAPAPAPQPVVSEGPIDEGQHFSLPSLLGGILIVAGMVPALTSLAGMPIIIATALAIFAGGICAYVFSLAGEVIEA